MAEYLSEDEATTVTSGGIWRDFTVRLEQALCLSLDKRSVSVPVMSSDDTLSLSVAKHTLLVEVTMTAGADPEDLMQEVSVGKMLNPSLLWCLFQQCVSVHEWLTNLKQQQRQCIKFAMTI